MKQTTAIIWLEHSLEVLVLGAVITAVYPVYQAFQAGNFTLASAGVSVGSALLAFILNGLKGIISNANFMQAMSDLWSQLQSQQQPVPPVVIHNNIPPAPVAPPAAAQPVIPQFKNTASSVPDFTAPLSTVTPPRVQ